MYFGFGSHASPVILLPGIRLVQICTTRNTPAVASANAYMHLAWRPDFAFFSLVNSIPNSM